MYDPVEDISLHADGANTRFDIPTTFYMLNRVEYRSTVTEALIHDCESLFDETTDEDFEQALDDEDRKRGGNSLQITVATAGSAGGFVADSISSIDISRYTHLEGWVKTNHADGLSAGDYVVRLDSGTVQGDSTDLEVLSVPAASADTWTFFRVALANPKDDTAIVSVGIEMNVDKTLHTVWFDDLRVVVNDSIKWSVVPRRLWRIDKEARDLIFVNGTVGFVGYNLLKLHGGDRPALLTSDSTVCEIDEQYVIARATALAYAAAGALPGEVGDMRRKLSGFWMGESNRAMRNFPVLTNARMVT